MVARATFASVGSLIMVPLRFSPEGRRAIATGLGMVLLTYDLCLEHYGGRARVHPDKSDDGRFVKLYFLWEVEKDQLVARALWNDAFSRKFKSNAFAVQGIEENVEMDGPAQFSDAGLNIPENAEAFARGLPYLEAIDSFVAQMEQTEAAWYREYSPLFGVR